jgi:NagD protein
MAVVPHAAVPLSSPDSATEVSSAMSSDPSTAEMVLPAKERAAIHSWLMDMDGVLVHEQHMIAGADRFLSLLRERKLPFLVLTNNPCSRVVTCQPESGGVDSMSPRTRSGRPRSRRPGSSATSGPGVRRSSSARAGLTTALHASGYTLTEQDPDYVVIGETRTYSFSRITQAIRHIVAGARFIATNPDPSGPSTEGPLPATGSLAALISRASGVSSYYVGKPNTLMMRTALNTIDGHSESTAMIGDSMKTTSSLDWRPDSRRSWYLRASHHPTTSTASPTARRES